MYSLLKIFYHFELAAACACAGALVGHDIKLNAVEQHYNSKV